VFSLAEDFTGEYLPYGFTRGEDFVLGDIQKTDTSFFRRDVSINLLNLEDIVSGYVDVNKKGVIASSTSMYTAYIPIEAETYTWLALPSFYGASSCARLYYYDEDKNPLGYVTGTTDTAFTSAVYTVPVSFTFTEKQLGTGAVYVGLVGRNKDKDTNMFVRGDTYPEEYVAYHDYWCIDDLSVDQSQVRGMEAAITEKVSADPSKQGNVLYGKTAIFDGDSICASITDESGQGAWAGRIGDKNGMTWKNYAVSGGTITNEQYHTDGTARHWVCANVDTLYAEHPEAEYIILEGGSNDADLIGSVLTDSPEKFGSYTMEDYGGAYDDTTFCGALETLFYKAVSYWPGKKLGFIVAYKMGKSSHGYTKDVSNRRAYFETAMALCEKWGVPCLNLWDGCCINPSLTACYDSSLSAEENRQAGKLLSDGQHPTSAGYDYITPMIEAWMRTL
jgi:hypothetical protein